MSATRLLILGIVRGYGRAHGYLIGNDLLSWGADEWANVKWGSIYHALKQLTKSGHLNAELLDVGRTDYELTDKGEAEFRRLLRDALRRPGHRPDMIGAGLAFLPALARDEAVELFQERLVALKAGQVAEWTGPAHARELTTLWTHASTSGEQWTRGVIERLMGGAYPMAGEPDSPGDPGSWPALKHRFA